MTYLRENDALRNWPKSSCITIYINIPVQFPEMPSPIYPLLQVQAYDPFVLLQLAFMSQLCVRRTHSSTSRGMKNWLYRNVFCFKGTFIY